jgi:hypothetical protein
MKREMFSVLELPNRSVAARKIFLFCFILFHPLSAQSSVDLQQGNADYPVPLPVALQALQDETPSFLFPGTVRSAAFSLQTTSTALAHNTSAGAEFAPFLIGNNVSLSKYLSGRLLRVLLRTRISIAAHTSAETGFHSAIGFRFMLHDDADLRADSLFQKKLVEWGNTDQTIHSQCEGTLPEERISCITESVSRNSAYQQQIDSLREAMKDSLWNKSVFELAFAGVYHSNKNSSITFQRFHGYLNGALPVFGSRGQIMFGISGWHGQSEHTSGTENRLSLQCRMVYGNPSERFFAELAGSAADRYIPDLGITIGAMQKVFNGVWVQTFVSQSLFGRELIGSIFKLQCSVAMPEL